MVFPGDQGFEHGPARDSGDLRGHGGEFEAGVLEQLLQALDIAGALPG